MRWYCLFFLVLWTGCRKEPASSERVEALFRERVAQLVTAVEHLEAGVDGHVTGPELHRRFRAARLAYKRVEWLTEYYFPETARNLNGPPLDEFEEDDNKVVPPEGFQVVEALLFPEWDTARAGELAGHTDILRANMNRLRWVTASNQLTDAHILDAVRQELLRIMSLGITGFDSSVALHSLPEARASLASLREVLAVYEDPELDRLFRKAEASLGGQFNEFNRLSFISTCLNPLVRELNRFRKERGIERIRTSSLLRNDSESFFGNAAVDPDHFRAGAADTTTIARIILGKRLFSDPVLSGDGTRSCAGCHRPDRAFSEDRATSISLSGKPLLRNAPSLLNVALQARLFYDSRVVYLEDQATDVIGNQEEMHGSLEVAAAKIRRQPTYDQAFRAAYAGGASAETIRHALATYERSLTALDSRFDRYMNGETMLLSPEEKRGFNLFAGKAKCATCHFLPLTNGTVPPFFEKTESEVIGVPAMTGWKNPKPDRDPGKFALTGADFHRGAFKTPTVRNSALTSPYMHNGVYRTLEEVVEFYDRGGGQGLGLDIPHQTLSPDPLRLTRTEKADLVAFLQSLSVEAASPVL